MAYLWKWTRDHHDDLHPLGQHVDCTEDLGQCRRCALCSRAIEWCRRTFDLLASPAGDFNLVLLDQLIKEERLRFVGCCNELNAGYAG